MPLGVRDEYQGETRCIPRILKYDLVDSSHDADSLFDNCFWRAVAGADDVCRAPALVLYMGISADHVGRSGS